jgi:DEAD/DEAH box helicase domain-containing protein
VEAVICHPGNPTIRTAHLLAAAAELPLGSTDHRYFGAGGMRLAESLPQLRRTAAGLVYRGADNPAAGISLRSSSRTGVGVVDTSTGTVLGAVDELRASSTVHPGAVYMHQGG